MSGTRLEILMAAYGEAGVKRIVETDPPRLEGVEYTVSWQQPKGDIPSYLASRDDFRILKFYTKGSSTNHNHAIDAARGEILLMADDDQKYTADSLRAIISAFDSHPDCDFLTFRFTTDGPAKYYPSESFDWRKPPKGAYVSTIEMAVRRSSLTPDTRFDENFGVNCPFACGDDQVFLHNLLKAGLKGRFIPMDICFHPGDTTGSRLSMAVMAEAKGAMFMKLHPLSWPLRMLAHARRSGSPLSYCRHWLRGARRFCRLHSHRSPEPRP